MQAAGALQTHCRPTFDPYEDRFKLQKKGYNLKKMLKYVDFAYFCTKKASL